MSTTANITDAVNAWFSANPTASTADVASAVQSAGGMTPAIASAIAAHYGTTPSAVNNAYTSLTSAPAAPAAPAAPVAPVASTPAQVNLNQYNQQTQQGIANSGLNNTMQTVLNGGTLSQIAQQGLNPQPVTSYKNASGNTVQAAPNTFVVSHPDGSGGSLNYFFTADPKTGATSPISDPSQNLTYTPGTSGSALGKVLSNPLVQIGASIASGGTLTPYIAGANAVNAAANGNTIGALLNAGIAGYTGGAFDNLGGTTTPTTPSTITDPYSPFYDPNSSLNTNYSLSGNATGAGLESGTGLQGQVGSGVNLYQPNAIDPTIGLPYTGTGLQTSGATNLSSMNGGQGLLASTNTGSSALNNAGNLPTNLSTGNTLGSTVNNLNTNVTTPSSVITNTTGNVTGTPPGTSTNNGVISNNANNSSSLLTPTNVLTGTALLNTLGTIGTNNAISNAANTQAGAASNVQQQIQNLYGMQAANQAPYQTAGTTAANLLASPQGQNYLTNQFNNTDLNAQLAPNYDFMLQQGLGQARNAANASGGLLSGNTLQGLNTYAQNYAQNAYQNAFNNYQTQRQNIFGNLAAQAGLGQTANQQLSALGGSLANTYGNVTTGLAASQAGAQTAQAVNNANLLSNLGNTALTASLLKPA